MAVHLSSLATARGADAVGGVLAGGLALWVALGAGAGAGRPAPVAALVAALVVAQVGGRVVADRVPHAPHRLLAAGVAGAAALTAPGFLRSGGAPLGYANANATLLALGTIAAVAAATAARDAQRRAGWWSLAAVSTVAVALTGSAAGVTSLAIGAALLAGAAIRRDAVVALLGGAIVVVLALGVTAAVARGSAALGLAERAVVRADLWSAAAEMAADHPLRGVGPGRFVEMSEVSPDPDLRWAHHGYLQAAAEWGITGLALLLALLGWAYVRLAMAARAAPHRAIVGATAVTVVALHATVDHVLHHPAVLISLAVVLGATTSGPGSLGSPRPRR